MMTINQQDILVIKLGGSIFDRKDTSIRDIVRLQKEGRKLILIHGGAYIVNKWLKRLNIPTEIVDGERVTSLESLEVVTAILGGLVNKELVAAILSKGGQAVGLSGVDGGIVHGKIRNKTMGYTGDIIKINPTPLMALLDAGIMPVVAPVSLHFDKPQDAPALLNINGDPIAGAIAAAIDAKKLIFLTDVNGIRGADGNPIAHLTPVEAEELLKSGVASGGMVPKLKACLNAITNDCQTFIIDGTVPHAIIKELAGESCGTTISESKQD